MIGLTTFGAIIFHETMYNDPKPSAEQKAVMVANCKALGNRINLFTQPTGWIQWGLNATAIEFTQIAKSMGMKVAWTCKETGYVDDHWAQYTSDVLQIASDAQTNGVDEAFTRVAVQGKRFPLAC